MNRLQRYATFFVMLYGCVLSANAGLNDIINKSEIYQGDVIFSKGEDRGQICLSQQSLEAKIILHHDDCDSELMRSLYIRGTLDKNQVLLLMLPDSLAQPFKLTVAEGVTLFLATSKGEVPVNQYGPKFYEGVVTVSKGQVIFNLESENVEPVMDHFYQKGQTAARGRSRIVPSPHYTHTMPPKDVPLDLVGYPF